MASNVAEKLPEQKAVAYAPQIGIATRAVHREQAASQQEQAAVPQIEVAKDVSSKNEKAERAQEEHEEAVRQDWKKLFEALFKVNYPAQPVAAPREQDAQTKRFIRSLSAEYAFRADGAKVVLRKNHGDIVVEQKTITFTSAASQADEENNFDLQNALVMARLAVQNPLMIEKGIRLKGSEAQIELLKEAIELVNKAQPEGQKLKIKDGAAAPISAFTQSADTQPASYTGLAAKGRRLTEVFSKLRPQMADKKNLVPVAAGEEEIAKPEAKKADSGVVGRVIKLMKPEPIAFNASRRKAVTGAGAALAVGVLLQPESADAAGLARGVRRERNFWESFFGVDFNDPHERRRTSAGTARRSARHPRRESRKARTARHRNQEAVRRQRTQEVRSHTRAQRAEKRRKDELARQKRDHKLQARRERLERRKIEKQAAHEKRKLDVQAKKEAGPQKQAEKNNSPRQKKREEQGQRDRSPVTGNEVILYNTHTGQSLRLNFNTCGDNSFCDKFNHFARDHHDPHGQFTNMAPKLQYYLRDIVTDLRRKGYKVDQVNVISGYRTVHTNVAVLKNPSGARSQHCFGRALDIQIQGVSPKAIRNSAENVKCDGVGLYSSFVHIDSRGSHARWFGKGVQPT